MCVLGKSGLKVSKIIIGCVSYGTPEWARAGFYLKKNLPTYQGRVRRHDAGLNALWRRLHAVISAGAGTSDLSESRQSKPTGRTTTSSFKLLTP
ncbi:hypothetical protein LshimejAT787_0906070 [Lyophyllum shimeji]|uniref:Uncharacterized protein n=1 Tax=Lyophyllum shimeji TaxID=47721 RepID=A0A9P3PRH3_LYOSH|nr:hypothetical protein LshimejAT787_0906070 [Lyophyllum shimeji]